MKKIVKTSGTSKGNQKTVTIDTNQRYNKTHKIKSERNLKTIASLYSKDSWANLNIQLFSKKNDLKVVNLNSITEIFDKKIDVLCLTPSQLVQASMSMKINRNVKQVTLGGEYSTQDIINKAKVMFPEARITHVYSSTETGDICSSSDMKEGFAEEKFKDFDVSEKNIKINNLVLNDMWILKKGRYYFAGRSDSVINIAGKKVNIEKIERKILDMKICDDCNIFTKKQKITGNILMMEYVGSIEKNDLKKILKNNFEKYEIPLLIKVSKINLNSNGKKKRVQLK